MTVSIEISIEIEHLLENEPFMKAWVALEIYGNFKAFQVMLLSHHVISPPKDEHKMYYKTLCPELSSPWTFLVG